MVCTETAVRANGKADAGVPHRRCAAKALECERCNDCIAMFFSFCYTFIKSYLNAEGDDHEKDFNNGTAFIGSIGIYELRIRQRRY